MKNLNKHPFLIYGICVVALQQILQFSLLNFDKNPIINLLLETDYIWRYIFYIPSELLWALRISNEDQYIITLILGFSACLSLDYAVFYVIKTFEGTLKIKQGKGLGKWHKKSNSEIQSIKAHQNAKKLNPAFPIMLFFVLHPFFMLLFEGGNSSVLEAFFSALSLSFLYYIAQILLKNPTLIFPGFKICKKCKNEDVIGLKKCTCGGKFEPPEYFTFQEFES